MNVATLELNESKASASVGLARLKVQSMVAASNCNKCEECQRGESWICFSCR